MKEDIVSHLPHAQIERDVPLSSHTSFAIGGPASYFARVIDPSECATMIQTAKKLHIDTLILGGGTNLLVSDTGFDGLVIKLDFQKVQFDPERMTLKVGAGYPTSHLVNWLVDRGLGGLEFAAGLPGTVGGALAGNAGCFGNTLSEFIASATIIDSTGEVKHITDKNWFEFNYRCSALAKRGAVLASAEFTVTQKDPKALRQKAAEYLKVRSNKHPNKGIRTAGSYFKNLPPAKSGGQRQAAGALLDKAGAHGLRVGDAAVFERHANIVINQRNASARDVLCLTKQMAALVKTRFGVTLEAEVRFVGTPPKGV